MDDEEPLLKEYSDGNCDVHPFEITERIELGQMAGMFFNRIGRTLFFLCIVIYLYGDAAIYAAAVPKSLRDVACTYKLPNGTACNNSLQDTDPCWSSTAVDRISGYRIFVAVFFIVMCPFAFFNVQKTKYLQIMTSASRWIAFGLMIILAAIRLGKHEGEGHPSVVEFSGIPNLFGVCVYSFMCHHSLPSMITPVENKSKLNKFLAADYILILGFYVVLSLTGIFAFDTIDDLYTLNFLPDDCNDSNQIIDFKPVQYFLALFPVFTLSTNFPIITITLRNNLKTLFYREGRPFPFIIDRIIFPLAAIIPPTAVAFGTDEVEFLVGITGSYAGAAIQYFIPAALVYCARKDAQSYFSANVKNQHTSPFNPLPNASSRRHS